MHDVGQQSLFDCQRPLVTTFDQVVETSTFILPRFECSSLRQIFNPYSAIANQQYPGGGEGIRTPDPRVANAVLCQLSYTPDKRWLRGRDLNPRPLGYEPNELPDCSTPRQISTSKSESKIRNPKSLVGLGRVELPTSRLSGVRSNQLSYRPKILFCEPITRTVNANFAAKKSHTSLQCGPFQRWTRPRAV